MKVFDPANIENGPGHWPLVTARDPIVGTPELDRTNLKPAYNLAFSADRKTLYLTFPNGTILFLR